MCGINCLGNPGARLFPPPKHISAKSHVSQITCQDEGSVARTAKQIRLVTFSTLYPNSAQPNHGVFVENRLRHLVASGAATSTVVAPVPWFPSRDARFGEWARCAAAPVEEMRHGLRVLHPRYAAP